MAFFEELKRLGYVEGSNIVVDWFSGEGQRERYGEVARQLVATRPDVIHSSGTPMTRELKAATSTIPIVAITGDPIIGGLITSLARPGGNVTGVSADAGIEIWGKRLELLAEAVGRIVNVHFISTLGAWDAPGGKAAREVAQKLRISLVSAGLSSPVNEAECRRVFASIQRDQVSGIMFSEEIEIYTHRLLLVQLVQHIHIPAIYVYRDQTEAGGLMSYSYDIKGAVRKNAAQVAEILKGASPADMPYLQEARLELVINLRTAKALGLVLPPTTLARANEVID